VRLDGRGINFMGIRVLVPIRPTAKHLDACRVQRRGSTAHKEITWSGIKKNIKRKTCRTNKKKSAEVEKHRSLLARGGRPAMRMCRSVL